MTNKYGWCIITCEFQKGVNMGVAIAESPVARDILIDATSSIQFSDVYMLIGILSKPFDIISLSVLSLATLVASFTIQPPRRR